MYNEVLVIEDNSDSLKLITWLLEEQEYHVTGVKTAEAALEVIEKNKFDIILMDIDLPGIDGIEAACRIRANPRFTTLPIIAVTAYALKSEVKKIMSAGFTALATKPIDEVKMLELLADLQKESLNGQNSRC